MKSIIICSVLVVSLLVLFVVGVVSGQAGLMVLPFCGWTPAVLGLGYIIGRSGLRVQLTTIADDTPAVKPVKRRQSRINQIGVSDVG